MNKATRPLPPAILTIGTILAIHLLLSSLYGLTAKQYAAQAGWSAELWLLVLDRFLYATFFLFCSLILFFLAKNFILRSPVKNNQPVPISSYHEATIPCFFQRMTIPTGLMAGFIGYAGLLLFTSITGTIQNSSESGYIQQEIIRGESPPWIFLMLTGLLTPFLEEAYYRGILLPFLLKFVSPVSAITFQALLFAFSHQLRALPFMLIIGVALGILCWRFGLGAAILAHSIYNSLILTDYYFELDF